MNDQIISKLPFNVDDNQIFVDGDGNIWKYDQQTVGWNSCGPLVSLQSANESTSGLLSPQYKLLLDTVAQFPGAFGIIVDKPIKQLINGNVKFISNSLDISCLSSSGTELNSTVGCNEEIVVGCGKSSDINEPTTLPRFVIKLNQSYLEKLCIDLPAPKGKKGKKGQKGLEGEPGFGDGPKGKTGSNGPNISELLKLKNIIFNDVPELSNKPIVNLEIVDEGRGPYLRSIKSETTLKANESAAKLLVSQVIRDIKFTNELTDGCTLNGMSNWAITKTGTDPLPDNLFLLRVSDVIDKSDSTVTTVSLSQYIESIINKYEQDIIELNKNWSLQVKNHIDSIDTQARTILSELANDLAMCESELPATEWALIFEQCDSPSPASALKLSATRGTVDTLSVSGQEWDLVV